MAGDSKTFVPAGELVRGHIQVWRIIIEVGHIGRVGYLKILYFLLTDIITLGRMGALSVRERSPSQSNPMNQRCFRMSLTPPLPDPSRSPGLSRQSFLTRAVAVFPIRLKMKLTGRRGADGPVGYLQCIDTLEDEGVGLHRVAGLEGRPAQHQLADVDAECPVVGRLVVSLVQNNLRRHVFRRSTKCPCLSTRG